MTWFFAGYSLQPHRGVAKRTDNYMHSVHDRQITKLSLRQSNTTEQSPTQPLLHVKMNPFFFLII